MVGDVQARSLRERSTGCCARTRSCRAFATQTPDLLWGIARCLLPVGGLPGTLVRLQGYLETNFEPGRRFANERDYQHQLDAWFAKANARTHKTQGTPARPPQDRAGGWRSCRCSRISTGAGRRESRSTYVRFDTNDYSPGPRLASRRVEVRVSQTNLTAILLDTGELAARHARAFARHRTITAIEHAPRGARASRRTCRARDRDPPVAL